MEEYLKTLLEQIRCKKAHASIYHEIRGHIEEQVADNIAEGMSKDDALKAALNDMGDPVQTGVEMDQLHRPQMAWRIIVAIGILTLFSILIQYLVTRDIPDNSAYFFRHHIFPIVFRFPNIYSGDAPQRNSLYAHFIQSAYNVTVLLSVRAAFWRNPISVSRKGLACCSKNFHLDGSSAFFNAGTAESRGNHFTIFHAGKPIDHCCMERMVYIP